MKFHIKKGDKVSVIAGVNKGRPAEVISINKKTLRVTIKGNEEDESFVNLKKHTKPERDPKFPEGGIVEKDPSVHISNLKLVDPKTGEPTKVGRRRKEVTIKGKTKTVSVRFNKTTGEEIA